MRFILKQVPCAWLFVLLATQGVGRGQTDDLMARSATAPAQEAPVVAEPQWTLVPSLSWSFFNKGRDSWQQESIELYAHLVEQRLLLDASIDIMDRPPSGEDISYGMGVTWYANEKIEAHGGIALTPDADFAPSERYTLGLSARVNTPLELHLDVERMQFGSFAPAWDQGITQIRPGLSWWFTDQTRLTLRYTHGWVHDQADYDCYSLALHIGDLPRDARLSIAFSYGTDPDLDFGTNSTALSDAYVVSVLYRQPVRADLTVFIGLEYVYRLRPGSGGELYQMWTPTIGLSWKF